MRDGLAAAALLVVSNTFMTMAWYGHLRFKDAPLPLVMQEAITLIVFVVFAAVWLGEGLTLRYLVAFGLILAAVTVAFI